MYTKREDFATQNDTLVVGGHCGEMALCQDLDNRGIELGKLLRFGIRYGLVLFDAWVQEITEHE